MLMEKCADENSTCKCLGKVHFGVLASNTDGSANFSSNFVTKDVRKLAPKKGAIECSNAQFGDPAVGQKKQCFCERPKPPAPLPKNVTKCGDEGEMCKCKGTVYMGKSFGEE